MRSKYRPSELRGTRGLMASVCIWQLPAWAVRLEVLQQCQAALVCVCSFLPDKVLPEAMLCYHAGVIANANLSAREINGNSDHALATSVF